MFDAQRSTETQEIISKLRTRGWTNAGIAQSLGMDQSAVWRWQTGKNVPTTASFEGLKRLLKGSNPKANAEAVRNELLHDVAADLLILFRRGWTIAILARRLNVHRFSVERYADAEMLAPAETRDGLKRLLNEPSPRTPEECVLAAMSIAADEHGLVYNRGLDYLGEVAGYSPSNLSRLLRSLESQGLITQLQSERKSPHRWRLNWRPVTRAAAGIGRWERVDG